ncbi:MAG: CTP synthase [Candidatus Peribacteraceae bacterium]|nr:CTP synthase [Candidatus Peribacteraceae bacterium]
MKTKFIFVTGGVCSSLGKGIATASIGALLKSAGFSVFPMKLDPYLNVDPGTMSPFQHGEVFVTDDGAETDLDLGHYERFIDVPLSKESTVTSGQIYKEVIEKERRGDFLGGTIQIIPHITRTIRERILLAAKVSKADVVLVEIGGTVGDIEGEPFLESIRHMRYQMGPEQTLFIHLTLLPYLAASGELKTKPTQASVRELRRIGIAPDLILARSDLPTEPKLLKKIALFCDVAEECVIPAPTVDSIYRVPENFEKSGITKIIEKKLKLPIKRPKLEKWQKLVKACSRKKKPLKIACVGKYTDLDDAYISVNEALKAAALAAGRELECVWVDSEKLTKKDSPEWKKVKSAAGILVPGGFGHRGIEGKILVAEYARKKKIPYFGLCLGMQILVIEFARNVLGLVDANSEEFNPKTKNPVINFIPNQRKIRKKGGTMRLGAYRCELKPGSTSRKLYGKKIISERHRHRFEVNNGYRDALETSGIRFAGINPDANLVEISEIKNHPFMLGCQFHPEFLSRPFRPHPLFLGFVRAAARK